MQSVVTAVALVTLIAGCGGGSSPPPAAVANDPGYPPPPYGYEEGGFRQPAGVLPDLLFAGKSVPVGQPADSVASQMISLGSLRSDALRFFVIETAGAWCWSRDHGVSGTLLVDAQKAFEHAAGIIAFPTYFIVDAATMRIIERTNDPLVATPLGPTLDQLLASY